MLGCVLWKTTVGVGLSSLSQRAQGSGLVASDFTHWANLSLMLVDLLLFEVVSCSPGSELAQWSRMTLSSCPNLSSPGIVGTTTSQVHSSLYLDLICVVGERQEFRGFCCLFLIWLVSPSLSFICLWFIFISDCKHRRWSLVVVEHNFKPSAREGGGRGRQISEFKACLVCVVSSRTSRLHRETFSKNVCVCVGGGDDLVIFLLLIHYWCKIFSCFTDSFCHFEETFSWIMKDYDELLKYYELYETIGTGNC